MLTEDNLPNQERPKTSISSWSLCQTQSSKSTCTPLWRTRSTPIVQSSHNSYQARPSRNTTIEFTSTFWDKSMPSLEVICGDLTLDQRFQRRQCLLVLMFATRVSKVLLGSAQPTTSICVNTTLKQVLKDRKAKKSSAQESSKSTSRVHSKLSETTITEIYQTTSSSTEMESATQWELKWSATSWNSWTRLFSRSTTLTETKSRSFLSTLWSSLTRESDKDSSRWELQAESPILLKEPMLTMDL